MKSEGILLTDLVPAHRTRFLLHMCLLSICIIEYIFQIFTRVNFVIFSEGFCKMGHVAIPHHIPYFRYGVFFCVEKILGFDDFCLLRELVNGTVKYLFE